MEEHRYRVASDQSTIADTIRYAIYNMDFMRLGIVTKVYGDGFVVDVECFNDYAKNKKQVLKGIELLRTGSKDVFIHCTPQPDDVVAVFAFRDYVKEIKKEKTAIMGNVLPYSQSCMKGIVIQPTQNEDKAKLIFKIKDDEVSVISKMPINLTSNSDINMDIQGEMAITAQRGIKLNSASGIDMNHGNLKVT